MKKGDHKDKENKKKPVVDRRDGKSSCIKILFEAIRKDKEKRGKQVKEGDP